MCDAINHGFLLIAAPKTKGTMPVDSLGGTGIFTAILVAIYCVEMMRFLKAHNIGIRLPDQVPPMIKNSFDLLIPVLVVVLTLYPLSLVIQSQFDMLIPQAIMAIFKPLVSAADSLPGDPAGGIDRPSAVVCRYSRRGYCVGNAANVLAHQSRDEPVGAGAGCAVAAYLYGSVLDVLHCGWWFRRDDGVGDLLSAESFRSSTLDWASERGPQHF